MARQSFFSSAAVVALAMGCGSSSPTHPAATNSSATTAADGMNGGSSASGASGAGGNGGASGASGASGGSGGSGASGASGSSGSSGANSSSGTDAGSVSTSGVADAGGSGGPCQPATCGSHKWACWPMPNAPTSGLPHPASYTNLGNGAVRDNVTCLVWQGTEGTPAASTFGVTMPDTMANNITYCAGLATMSYAGMSDWRVPTRVEVASIVDYTKTSGEVINSIFTWTKGLTTQTYDRTYSLWYETIAGISKAGNIGWVYNLGAGTYPGGGGLTSNDFLETTTSNVRCVSGNGAGETELEQAVEPASHYTVDNGEVTDNYTGLIWQQSDSSANAGAQVPWSSAAPYCSGLNLNGHTWRVPSLNELATLVDEAKVQPAVNTTVFPGTHPTSSDSGCMNNGLPTWYWASEPLATETSTDWGIDFCDGYTGADNFTGDGGWNFYTTGWVKCVR